MRINKITNNWNVYLDSQVGKRQSEVKKIREKKAKETLGIIEEFVNGKINVSKFYEEIKIAFAERIELKDGTKSGTVWGANNFKGMMFFNLIIKFCLEKDLVSLENILRKCIRLPKNKGIAKVYIDEFTDWVKKFVFDLDEKKVKKIDPEKDYKRVKSNINPSYSIFFLSVFWSIQDIKNYPIYWTASEKVFKKTDYYVFKDSNGEKYKKFIELNFDLLKFIQQKTKNENVDIQDISGVLSFVNEMEEGQDENGGAKPPKPVKRYIDEFLKESDFPDEDAEEDYRYIEKYQEIFAEDEIDFMDLKDFKNFYLSRRYGYVGFMTILNKTINEATAKDEDRIREAIKYLLYGEDEVSVRINNLQDENGDYKIRGLGESVITKLLATVYPDKFITVFNYKGKMGKREMMKLLDIPLPVNESDLSIGDLAVMSNESILNFFKGKKFKDNLHIRNFLYWYKHEIEQEDKIPEEKLMEQIKNNLNMEEIYINKIINQLKNKGQIILYGPPGTGKTYIAKELARYLTNNKKDNFRIIQFHPSYGYEDLIQCIFPKKEGRELVYEYKDGTFKEFCEGAVDERNYFVFIIDEINRGNIAKIFGELIYLLEYRNDEVNLQYSGDTFSIPKNILIIGTMNTADKSIALLDVALRRRFKFFEIEPSAEILRKYYEKKIRKGQIKFEGVKLSDLTGIFKKLNNKIGEDIDKHHKIGHSYFMKKEGMVDKEYLMNIWEFEIKPLLEEYFFDESYKVKEYFTIFNND